MKKEIRILIAYDGSPCADAALDDLKRAGMPRNAEVVILTVSEIWLRASSTCDVQSAQPSSSISTFTKSRSPQIQTAVGVTPLSEARGLALKAKARLEKHFPAWAIEAEESCGSPSREILKRAESFKSDLIVVGSQGHSALGRFLLGSVSQVVVNEARCTVRVSRGTAWKDGSPVRILIGLDGTTSSELAVSAVAARVWPSGSAVRLITVVDPGNGALAESSRGKDSPASTATHREWIDSFMKPATKKLRATHLSVSKRIDEGDPKRLLIADAEEWGADSIFLGASSAQVLERFLLGSVATAVVARAHCSVEVVRGGY